MFLSFMVDEDWKYTLNNFVNASVFLTSYAKTLIALNPNNNHTNPTTTSLLLLTENGALMCGISSTLPTCTTISIHLSKGITPLQSE